MEAIWQDPFLDPQGLELAVCAGVVTLLGVDIPAPCIARVREVLEAIPGIIDVQDGTTAALQRAA